MTVTHVVAQGDLVSVRWVFRGTHTADGYGGLPATGTHCGLFHVIWRDFPMELATCFRGERCISQLHQGS